MFYRFDDSSVRLSGRWFCSEDFATTTASGSKIEIAFTGDYALFQFDISKAQHPFPHLWIRIDGGVKTEVAVDNLIRIECVEDGEHIAEIIMKSSAEAQNRWIYPATTGVCFKGFYADGNGKLYDNNKKTIEFIGDSITEGVLTDNIPQSFFGDNHGLNRVYQDDSTATYAYLTAKNLGLEPIIMGYGAVGTTHGGCGNVPRICESYPYCFENAPISHKSADYIVINHGTNDMHHTVEEFSRCFIEMLDVITKMNENSKIAVMVPFCGCFHDEIIALVAEYNSKNNTDIRVIDTTGWLPKEPIHPLRDGHKIAAEKLTEQLKIEFNI